MGKAKKKRSASSEAWRKLYSLAEQVLELGPWRWMEEDEIFGVKFPQNETVGFVSVMGMLGQHRAVTVYLGAEGLRGFWRVEGMESTEEPTAIVHVPQLMASFEDRSQLDQRDIAQIRRLGLSYGKEESWPLFRSFRPGHYPWFLELSEVKMLSCALEQTLVVAERAREDDSLLEPEDEDRYLVRTPRTSAGQLIWEDRRMTFQMEPFHVVPDIDPGAVDELKALRQSENELELDCISIPARIGSQGERPRWPHMLIILDAESGVILGFELLEAVDGLPAMWREIPSRTLSILLKSEVRPARIRVRSTLYGELLRPVLDALEVDVVKQAELPALEEARESLFEYMSR
jgi:hypothetical protein